MAAGTTARDEAKKKAAQTDERRFMVEAIGDGASAQPSDDTETATELVREAIDETRHLVALEVALAREEIKAEIAHAKVGAMTLAGASAVGLSGCTLCLVALAAAFSTLWLAALVLGAILLLCAGAAAFLGWRAIPKRPMSGTRERLESNVKQLKERIA